VGNTYWWNVTNIDMIRCAHGRFEGLDDSADALGITNVSFCPHDDFNFTLSGSFSASQAQGLSIIVDYCT
jgi:hypothetical protein